MATRFELISALYDDVSKDVIRSPSNWQEFLKSSCNNYGLPFSEQLLVYAQKPDAVAVLPMASWNRRFGRWINKGAKGIALFDVSNKNYPRLKYVFDVSDTHEGEQAKEVPIWHMKNEYADNGHNFSSETKQRCKSQLRVAEQQFNGFIASNANQFLNPNTIEIIGCALNYS